MPPGHKFAEFDSDKPSWSSKHQVNLSLGGSSIPDDFGAWMGIWGTLEEQTRKEQQEKERLKKCWSLVLSQLVSIVDETP